MARDTTIRPVPVDANDWKLTDRWTQLGTKKYTGVDTTTGVAVTAPCDCKDVLIIPSAAATITGTITGAVDAIDFSGPLSLPMVAVSGASLFTIKAASGTITVGIAFGR